MKKSSFQALLKGAFCLFLAAGMNLMPLYAAEGTTENMGTQAVQQSVTVSGVITDKTGEPVIGANVLEKGTTNGVITDFDGNYTLTVSGGNSVLVFSYIGYKTQEVTVGSQKKIDIVLVEDTEMMDEVVVIGYGTQKKGDVTSAVSSVKAEDFTTGKIGDAAELIKGKVAGLTIAKGSGDPGAESTIRLRGIISLERMVDAMSLAPRRLFKMGGGVIAEGERADLLLADLDSCYTVDSQKFLSKGKSTPFEGWKVKGETVMTIYGGKVVYER